MKRIDISEKEYMVMMVFIHTIVHEDKSLRWKLQEYLPQHVESEEKLDFLYDSILAFDTEKIRNLLPEEKLILITFVGTILVTWEKDSLFSDLCRENGVSFMKLAYIVFNAYNIERIENYWEERDDRVNDDR